MFGFPFMPTLSLPPCRAEIKVGLLQTFNIPLRLIVGSFSTWPVQHGTCAHPHKAAFVTHLSARVPVAFHACVCFRSIIAGGTSSFFCVSQSLFFPGCMMFMEYEFDMDEAARMEEELMREAELEHLQMEAEEATAHSEASGCSQQLREAGMPQHRVADMRSSTASVAMHIACAPGDTYGGLSVSPPCVPSQASSSQGFGLDSETMAPQTPPPRSVASRVRSVTPEKGRRDLFVASDKNGPEDVEAPCLPIVASPVDQDAHCSHGGLSLPPSPSATAVSAANSQPDVGPSSPPKRRRIRGKGGEASTAPEVLKSTSGAARPPQVSEAEFRAFMVALGSVAWPAVDEWKNKTPREQRAFAYWLMRTAWCKMKADQLKGHVTSKLKSSKHSGGWKNVWKDARAHFQALTLEYRTELLAKFVDASRPPDHVAETFKSVAAWKDLGARKVHSALYTWISTDWILPADAMSRPPCMDAAIAAAKSLEWVDGLRRKLRNVIADVVKDHLNLDWASAMEICSRTLQQNGIAQLHFHVLLRHSEVALWMPSPDRMKLGNVRPHISATPTLGQVRAASPRSWAGYFYCSVQKYGQVAVETNREAFRDYPVQGQWVMSLFQAGKISAAQARQLIYRVAHGVTRLLADLDMVDREMDHARVLEAQRSALEQLATARKPWRSIEAVEAWDACYGELKERYEFLVLDGPSRMGKTAFGRSKCPVGQEVLEINCAAGGEPDLRSYKYGQHGLILCDEIEAEAVAGQRKLFQGGTAIVQLGTSPTNIHVYTVFVHRVRIICASNNWMASLERLSADDRAWIEKNSVYVFCDTPLWVQS